MISRHINMGRAQHEVARKRYIISFGLAVIKRRSSAKKPKNADGPRFGPLFGPNRHLRYKWVARRGGECRRRVQSVNSEAGQAAARAAFVAREESPNWAGHGGG